MSSSAFSPRLPRNDVGLTNQPDLDDADLNVSADNEMPTWHSLSAIQIYYHMRQAKA